MVDPYKRIRIFVSKLYYHPDDHRSYVSMNRILNNGNRVNLISQNIHLSCNKAQTPQRYIALLHHKIGDIKINSPRLHTVHEHRATDDEVQPRLRGSHSHLVSTCVLGRASYFLDAGAWRLTDATRRGTACHAQRTSTPPSARTTICRRTTGT